MSANRGARDDGASISGPSGAPALTAFVAAMGTTFRVETDASMLGLVLDRVDHKPPREGWESFSLTFTGAGGLAQGTYTVHSPQIGSFPIFLVPVRSGDVQQYEAVFNRVAP